MVVLPVYRELASLSEGFGAVTYSTREWLLACVSVLVLLQVLRKHKGLRAMLALVTLLISVLYNVPLQRVLGCEEPLAAL
jgi:hypothetical protein